MIDQGEFNEQRLTVGDLAHPIKSAQFVSTKNEGRLVGDKPPGDGG
jgi:hypothetical protein